MTTNLSVRKTDTGTLEVRFVINRDGSTDTLACPFGSEDAILFAAVILAASETIAEQHGLAFADNLDPQALADAYNESRASFNDPPITIRDSIYMGGDKGSVFVRPAETGEPAVTIGVDVPSEDVGDDEMLRAVLDVSVEYARAFAVMTVRLAVSTEPES